MNLPKLISNMTDGELLAFLSQMREKRAEVVTPRKRSSTKMPGAKKDVDVIEKLRLMSPEQRKALAALLKG